MKINHKIAFKITIIILAVLVALLVGALMILATGESVFKTYSIIISMPFSNFLLFHTVPHAVPSAL